MTEDRKRWVGQVINGQFELRQYLGGSKSAAVFLTDRGEQGRQPAAIKIIAGDQKRLERQLSRWSAAAKFSNPHLLRIFESGRCKLDESDFIYVVMEYAEEDLSQILPTRPLTPAETRVTLAPTLDALAYLHAKDFVHAHIKPANIMAIGDHIKISSDGVRSMGEGPELPAQEVSVYDPPEAASGVSSPAGDVWSLGVTLVEVLTQHPPAVASATKLPVVPESLPAPFLEIVRRCLVIDPQRRGSIAEIAAQLDPPISPRPAPRVTPPIKAAHPPASASFTTSRATIPPRPSPPAPVPASAPPPRPPVRLQPSSLSGARPRKGSTRSPYLVPAIVAAFVLAAILGGARLLNRRETQQALPAGLIARQSSTPTTPSSADHERALRPVPEGVPENTGPQTKLGSRSRSSEDKLASKQPAAPRNSESAANSSDLSEKPQRPQTFDASRGVRSDAAEKMPSGPSGPGEVLQQDIPNVSPKARASIQGKVRVTIKLQVDQAGSVSHAEIVSPGPSKYFADLALKSAQHWEFAPAKLENQYVPSEWNLRYEFSNAGTKVYPQQTSPRVSR